MEDTLINVHSPNFISHSVVGLVLNVTTIVLLAAYFQRKGNKDEKEDKTQGSEVYHLQKFPVSLGLLDGLLSYLELRRLGLAWLDQMSAAAKGKIAKSSLGFKSMYIVWDVEVAKKLLKSTPDYLHKPKEMYDCVLPGSFSNGLFASPLSVWKTHRKVINPAFSYRSLGIYFQYTNDCAKECIEESCEIMTNLGADQLDQTQMGDLLDSYGFQLTTQIVLGQACSNATKHTRKELLNCLFVGKEITLERFLSPYLFIPPLWKYHPKRKILDGTFETTSTLLRQAIKTFRQLQSERHTTESGGSESVDHSKPESLESTMDDGSSKTIECVLEQLLSSGLPENEIMDEIITFLAAGYETVRVALGLLIFHLALFPEHQRKCQEEVDAIFEATSSEQNTTPNLTPDDLSKMKYLEQCIMESLRFTPTAPLFARQPQAPLELTPNVTVQPGEIVVISPWIIHRHADYFPKPDVFDPERFTAENIKQRHAYCFIPFSMGTRNCIGYKLAVTEIKVFMAWILRHYDLTTTDKANDVKFHYDITTRLERPYNITYKKRVSGCAK